jgi:hypothetical protein
MAYLWEQARNKYQKLREQRRLQKWYLLRRRTALVGVLDFHEVRPLRLEFLHELPDLQRRSYVLCTPALDSCDKWTDCTFP